MSKRDNRRLLRSMVGSQARCWMCHYTGGFSLHTAKAGARALAVDKDQEALSQLEVNARRNGVAGRVGGHAGGTRSRRWRRCRPRADLRMWWLIHRRWQSTRMMCHPRKRLFTRLALGALMVLEPNGVLLLSTCAYHITVNDLIEAARIAAGEWGGGRRCWR